MATGYILVDNPPATPQGTYPRRGGARLSGTCIVHTSEGAWQAGVDSLTRLVRTRSDYGCYHQACDWEDIAKYYPWEWETWQDTETNNWAVGIAAACRTVDWRTMPADISEGYYRNMATMAAEFITYMKKTYNITVPVRRLSGAEARARVPGFCAHGDSGVSRSDPGVDFDWARFFRYINEALSGIKPAAAEQEDDKMLIIGKQKGKDPVWIGDGVVRRHIPDPRALQDLQWFAKNGFLKIYENGKVIEFEFLDGLGVDVVGATRDAVLNTEVPWYGFDGKRPTEGRTSTTVALQTGWTDASFTGLAAKLNEVLDLLRGSQVGDQVIEQVKEKLNNLSVTLKATPEA